MLNVNVFDQMHTFLLSLVLGVVICIFYDLFRAMHLTIIKGFFEVLVTDLVFWLVFSVITYFFLLLRCSGFVRFYVLIGITVGFLLFRITFSKYILRIFIIVVKFCVAVLHFVGDKICLILLSFDKYFKKTVNALKKGLQKSFHMMYNQLKFWCLKLRKGKGEINGKRNEKAR